MNSPSQDGIPFIPENSPFTLEQRAYLNGFFAGLFSRTSPAPMNGEASADAGKSLKPLTILFGSQTGTTESLAKKVAGEAGKRGFVPSVVDMGQFEVQSLKETSRLLVLTSTYGDGDPPDNAKTFWENLQSDSVPPLKGVEFSVLGLGDTNYSKFCQYAKNLDQRLEGLGASRVHPRVDCDVDYEEPFHKWLSGVLSTLDQSNGSSPKPEVIVMKDEEKPSYSKKNPFSAKLLTNRKLNAEGSGKDTRHFEISLAGSGMTYEVGDALGVIPTNCPELVEEIVNVLGFSGNETFRQALLKNYEVSRLSKNMLEAFSKKTGDKKLLELVSPTANGNLDQYLYGRGLIDLLLEFPRLKFSEEEFVSFLRPLQPRLYSIASSLKACPGQVHLTVAAVRYSSHGRNRKGVCSTFMADRVNSEMALPVFVHNNKAFRLPEDSSKPVIMVGPGTGIAPFRAFLQERKVTVAKGKNWLFFGDQKAKSDFLYRDELEEMKILGVLNELDTAFSRDQAHKVYVQDRMKERAKELYAWLEEGAYFYVCGDASRMAKDVDLALHQVIEMGGGVSADKAKEYVQKLKSEKRYRRDVY